MTRNTNARVAGFAFLVYIAAALTGMVLTSRAAVGEGIAARLANMAQHVSYVRAGFVLELLGCFCALVLGVTLYAITRDEDQDLAMLAMTCRVAEGVIGAVSLQQLLGRLWLATAAGADAPDSASAAALGAYLMTLPWSSDIGATFFAVGSLIFACLLLRGRMIPAGLAWLGVIASILVVVGLPLSAVGVLPRMVKMLMWLPMLAFEVPLGVWLIVKGVRAPLRRQAA